MSSQAGLHLSINSFQAHSPCISQQLSPLSNPLPQLQSALLSSIKLNADSQVTQSSLSSPSHLKAISLILQLERLKTNMLNKAFKTIQMIKLKSPILLFPFLGEGSIKKQSASTKTSIGEFSTLSQELQSIQKQPLFKTKEVSIKSEEQSQKNSLKFLKRQVFMQKIIISEKQCQIKSLKQQLAESHRRQLKQERKKKQSLLSLAEQLAEKSECIQQLKSVIRGLESRLKIPQTQLMVLQEDAQTLRRSIERLQGVNDKLNNDVQKIKEQYEATVKRNQLLLKENIHLKNQIQILKEELFENELEQKINQHKGEQIAAWERKINLKQNRIKLFDQKIEKSQLNILHSFSNQRQNDVSILSEKIQKILSFIFHIDNPNSSLIPYQMFEKQQIQLLESHKKRVILFEQNSMKHYKQPHVSSQGSCVDVSCLQMMKHAEEQSDKIQRDTIRLRLENEKNRLIQKIADLKRRELHARSIVLTFISSICQKLSKQNNEPLYQVLQFFQYSQSEKRVLVQAKPKKILGFF